MLISEEALALEEKDMAMSFNGFPFRVFLTEADDGAKVTIGVNESSETIVVGLASIHGKPSRETIRKIIQMFWPAGAIVVEPHIVGAPDFPRNTVTLVCQRYYPTNGR